MIPGAVRTLNTPGPGIIVIPGLKTWLGLPLLEVAPIVKLNRPGTVGVPEITPVLLLRDRPVGSAPAVTEYVGEMHPAVGKVWE